MCIHTEKSSRNIIKSNRSNIVLNIFRLIWHQTDFRLVPNQTGNSKYNLISVWFNKISLCVGIQLESGMHMKHIKQLCIRDLHLFIPYFIIYTQEQVVYKGTLSLRLFNVRLIKSLAFISQWRINLFNDWFNGRLIQ